MKRKMAVLTAITVSLVMSSCGSSNIGASTETTPAETAATQQTEVTEQTQATETTVSETQTAAVESEVDEEEPEIELPEGFDSEEELVEAFNDFLFRECITPEGMANYIPQLYIESISDMSLSPEYYTFYDADDEKAYIEDICGKLYDKFIIPYEVSLNSLPLTEDGLADFAIVQSETYGMDFSFDTFEHFEKQLQELITDGYPPLGIESGYYKYPNDFKFDTMPRETFIKWSYQGIQSYIKQVYYEIFFRNNSYVTETYLNEYNTSLETRKQYCNECLNHFFEEIEIDNSDLRNNEKWNQEKWKFDDNEVLSRRFYHRPFSYYNFQREIDYNLLKIQGKIYLSSNSFIITERLYGSVLLGMKEKSAD